MIGERANPMRTPLRSVRGLGAARSGTQHFWWSRVTGVALISLNIFFVITAMALLGRNHAAVVQILGSPAVAILMLLFIVTTAYHMWIGMQEIILDYVHHDLWKLFALMANIFFCFCVGFACAFAVLKLSFGV
jgi:succinate dehydrogenase / fumarate reductase membrane anchor subunit